MVPERDPHTEPVVASLRAWRSLRVPVKDVAALRKQPGPGRELPVGLLKHADEQTIVGLTALRQACAAAGLDGPFTRWGVIAAPRFLGRAAMACSLTKFRSEGAWGVSPHVIPHRSLHSPSGTISQALDCHGPNFGVGGGPGSEAEGILAATSLLAELTGQTGQAETGVWLVLSRIEPELPPDDGGTPPAEAWVEAVALALTPGGPGPGPGVRLTSGPAWPCGPCSLTVVRDLLTRLGAGEGPATCPLGGGVRLAFVPEDVAAPVLPPARARRSA